MLHNQNKYNQFKNNAVVDQEVLNRYHQFMVSKMTERDKILEPHLNNLLTLIKPKNI